MRLHELTRLIRSKNAGPFVLTFDIIFSNQEGYDRVVGGHVVTPERIGGIYDLPPDRVSVFECPAALAIKISLPRAHTSGDPHDSDVFGCQQHAPLVDLEL